MIPANTENRIAGVLNCPALTSKPWLSCKAKPYHRVNTARMIDPSRATICKAVEANLATEI